MKKLLSLPAAARTIGIARWTLRSWVQKGQGPAFKLTPGGHYLFREADVLQWLSELKGPAVIKMPERKESAQAAA
jgi:excisionase family DNA binding protein